MKRILFVCLGNICRSPTAEGIMVKMIEQKNLSDKYQCDSAGTSGYHIGEKADQRMISHAKKRNYDLTSLSRQFDRKNDFELFDYIITMDQHNYENVCDYDFGNKYQHKIYPMVKFCSKHKVDKVPDPYYGGAQGFENVMDILEDACRGLLEYVESN
ncbi:low molecular weight protein-tyrosine-phosphatase [Candidatus Uabimicrobium sp. HlEnr_7]|uniref:low molecular weight protein-tyrosine-phosphatase n=1 Tax=Candidatus Uabimicrobium helgolandensis TaxID=3095367 RepID=UPI003556929B